MAAIDIVGDARLRCHICSRISPAYFPSCPRCLSDTFTSLQVEPIVLPQDFFQNYLESSVDAVQRQIYESRAKELINTFERKGYLLCVERKVIVYISTRSRFCYSQVNTLLARDAIRGRFGNQNRTFMLRPTFVAGAPPYSTSYLISCPPGVTATQIASARYNPPRLIPSVASILQGNNIPPLGMHLLCSLCKLPQDDGSTDKMDKEDYHSDETGVADGLSFRVLSPCSHIFHTTCISNWFQSERLECPRCRYIVVTDDEDFNMWASLHNARLPVEGGAGTSLEI